MGRILFCFLFWDSISLCFPRSGYLYRVDIKGRHAPSCPGQKMYAYKRLTLLWKIYWQKVWRNMPHKWEPKRSRSLYMTKCMHTVQRHAYWLYITKELANQEDVPNVNMYSSNLATYKYSRQILKDLRERERSQCGISKGLQ